MKEMLNKLKVLGVNAVVLNNRVFIVTKDGEMLEANDVLTQLKGK